MLYILYGQDDYSLHQSLEAIKKGLGDRSLLDMNTTMLDSQDMTLERLKMACETIPFMAPKRLVIVKGLLEKSEPKGKAGTLKKAEKTGKLHNDLKPIVDCISRIPDSTILVLIDEGGIKAGNPLLKELSGKGEIKPFPPLKGKDLKQWVQRYVASKGSTAATEAIDLLTELVGGNLWVMAGELDKLILFASGRAITEEDVKAVVGYAQEFSVFNMVDAILEFRPDRAEQSLQQLLQRGAAPAQLLVILARQLNRLVQIKEMKNRGETDIAIKSKLGITLPFVWQKAQSQAQRHSLDRLETIYRKLLEADLSIKTGRYDGELALYILVAELCQRKV